VTDKNGYIVFQPHRHHWVDGRARRRRQDIATWGRYVVRHFSSSRWNRPTKPHFDLTANKNVLQCGVDLVCMSTSRRRFETFTGCDLRNASISSRSGATGSFRLHSARRRLQPPPSPVVVILAACDPTYTAFHYRRSCVSDGWYSRLPNSLPPDVTSAPALTSSESPQNWPFPNIISLLTVLEFYFLHRV